ncbi:MAG: choice-of-anchor T family protein, partial [Candidatus Thermoplasmatota archaeon]|nr:choice-of-anchor T family protein [Candidatus Thermoplasmatota archaeon]
MSTRKSTFTVLFIYVASLLLVAVPAQAQTPIPTAAVSITCQPAEIKVDVKPGSTLVGFTTCTASNPTSYIEKVALSVTSDGLAAAAPGDIYVGPGSEEDFQVVVRAQPFMTMQARTLKVEGTVQEISGLPPANVATSGASMIVSITQFALLQVEAVE